MVKGASFLVRVYPLYGHLNWQVMSRVCVCVCVRTHVDDGGVKVYVYVGSCCDYGCTTE